jgi:hypothetical protein
MVEPKRSDENRTENDPEMTLREERLDRELRLVRKMRLALGRVVALLQQDSNMAVPPTSTWQTR